MTPEIMQARQQRVSRLLADAGIDYPLARHLAKAIIEACQGIVDDSMSMHLVTDHGDKYAVPKPEPETGGNWPR